MTDTESQLEWTPPASGERWTEEVGRGMVESLRRSGDTQGKFARRHGLNSQRVKYWRDRVEGRGTAKPVRAGRSAAPVSFAPVRVVDKAGASAPALEVVVGGAVVRVPAKFDEQHLRRLVAALSGGSC